MHLRFGRPKLKSPPELVAKTHTALGVLTSVQKDRTVDKAVEDVARYLEQMKLYVFGTEDAPPTKDKVLLLAREAARQGLLLGLCRNLGELEFESRKDAAQVVGALLRVKDDDEMEEDKKYPTVHYVKSYPIILECLFNGYRDSQIALNCGSMLRDCIRHEALARAMLKSSVFLQFFQDIEERKFEIASDAFTTFKDLLTRHKKVVAEYLDSNFEQFFARYNQGLKSKNYMTRRQLLKLLGQLLLDRANVTIMLRYVSDVQSLILMMNLLKDDYSSIQYEAFHVFQVFVANPHKPHGVLEILRTNKEKLLRFLEDFHHDKVVSAEEDNRFKSEKGFVINEISLIEKRNGAK